MKRHKNNRDNGMNRNAKKASERNESEEKDVIMANNIVTYLVPERRHNYLDCCFMCLDTEGPRKMNNRAKNLKMEEGSECSEGGDEEDGADKKMKTGAYVKCSFENCKQRMHQQCAEDFICSEYSPTQAQLLLKLKGPVCPAHFCWHCYEERAKNASRFGELVDCEWCMRSFHLQCMPAGSKIISNCQGERKKFICHGHVLNTPTITSSMRMKYCTECEEIVEDASKTGSKIKDGDQRMECRKCTNVYHKKCAFEVVKGPGSETYNHDLCTFCVCGITIVPNQKVLAYYPYNYLGCPPGNYPGTAVSLDEVPEERRKEFKNLGVPGWIPIKWKWNGEEVEKKKGLEPKPFFNLIHKSQVQRITEDCEENLTDKNFINELEEVRMKFRAPTFPLDNEAMMRTIEIVDDNIYPKGFRKQLWERKEVHECECEIDKVTKKKCNTSTCLNRVVQVECPESCGKYCQNRGLANLMKERKERQLNPSADKVALKYEVKESAGKGMGVFATAHFEPLDFGLEYVGEVIDTEGLTESLKRTEDVRSRDEWPFAMGLKSGYFVDARFKGGLARYVNHSCDPNMKVDMFEVPVKYDADDDAWYEPRLRIDILKNIKPGDEMTMDYKMAKAEGHSLDKCYCEATNCTGFIGKNDDEDDDSDDDADKENAKKNQTKKRTSAKKRRQSMNKVSSMRRSSGSNDHSKKKK